MKAFSILIIWLLSSTMDLERNSLTLQLIPLLNSMRVCAVDIKDKVSYVVYSCIAGVSPPVYSYSLSCVNCISVGLAKARPNETPRGWTTIRDYLHLHCICSVNYAQIRIVPTTSCISGYI